MSYKGTQERNRRLKKLYNKTKHSYGAGAWFDEEKGRFIRYSCHNKSLKKICRRTTRRRLKKLDYIGNGNKYKREFDYWWTIL